MADPVHKIFSMYQNMEPYLGNMEHMRNPNVHEVNEQNTFFKKASKW